MLTENKVNFEYSSVCDSSLIKGRQKQPFNIPQQLSPVRLISLDSLYSEDGGGFILLLKSVSYYQ